MGNRRMDKVTAVLDFPPPTFEASPAEHRNFGIRPELSLIEWAQRHIHLIDGPLVGDGPPMPWGPALFPLQSEPMESLTDERWSRTVLITAPQAWGKTQAVAVAPLLYAIHYLHTTPFYVASDKDLAVAQWDKKVKPAILADRGMAGLLFENLDFGGTKSLRHFTNDTSMYMVGSESIGKLSGRTSSVVICDDVQAYPATLPRFGHPADYAMTRSGAMPPDQCIHAHIGTAGVIEDYLWRSLEASAFFVPFVPCQGCGVFQLIEFDRFVFDLEDVQTTRRQTWMRCANSDCEYQIRFEELPAMLADHLWVSMPPGANWILEPPEGGGRLELDKASVYPNTLRNSNVAGFWANAFYWPYGPNWGDHAADWIERRGDPDKEKHFQQNIRVVAWKEPEVDEERLTAEEIEAHVVEGFAAHTVPEQADLVTITVDVQSGYVYYIARAWRKVDGTSWLIGLRTFGKGLRGRQFDVRSERQEARTLGIVQGLDEVDRVAREGWPIVDVQGKETGRIEATLCLVDRGYQPHTVGNWWTVKHGGRWRMISGLGAGFGGTLWPNKTKVDSRGRPYRQINVNESKHIVRRLLRISQGESGYWHMPSSGIHENTIRAYFAQMASERFDKTKTPPRWEKISIGVANHYWDCEVYQISAAMASGVRLTGCVSDEQKQVVMTDWFKRQREKYKKVR